MHRIDDPSAVATLPTPTAQGTPGYFTEGNPTTGQEATIVTNDWANAIQEEICYVIAQAAIALSKTDRTQLWQALQKIGRIRLTANITYYVSPTGNDYTGDGLTPATAWATGTHAYLYVRDQLNTNGYQVTIQLLPGTHQPIWAPYPCVGAPPIIQGTVGNASQVIVSNPNGPAISCGSGAQLTVQWLTVQATAPPVTDYGAVGIGLNCAEGGILMFSNINFGACSYVHIGCGYGGVIQLPSSGTPYSITGGAMCHVFANCGMVGLAEGKVTLTGTPAFSSCFAQAAGSVLYCPGMTFTGGATGQRYSVLQNGVINTGGGGPNYFPGSIAGAVYTGGQYG